MVLGITNARDYRIKLEADLDRLQKRIDDPSLAINAATATYHLHEWIWAHAMKPARPFACRGEQFSNIGEFRNWLHDNCLHFKLIRELTNGAKHAKPVHSGGQVTGYGRGPFGIGPCGKAYLLIDLERGEGTDRYLVASEIIQQAAEFMIALSKEVGS